MKTSTLLTIAATALLALSSCEKKETVIYRQIKTFPTAELIRKYNEECPKGEHRDSVNGFYNNAVIQLENLARMHNFQAYIDYIDQAPSDSTRAFATTQAEKLLTDSINFNPTIALCDTYLRLFPNGAQLAQVSSQREVLIEEQRRAARKREIDRAIDRVLRDLQSAESYYFSYNVGWFDQYYYYKNNVERSLAAARRYYDEMTPTQRSRLENGLQFYYMYM